MPPRATGTQPVVTGAILGRVSTSSPGVQARIGVRDRRRSHRDLGAPHLHNSAGDAGYQVCKIQVHPRSIRIHAGSLSSQSRSSHTFVPGSPEA
ncbi:hypothetical protein BDM02DRAFT_3119623 [Thelephora ganbajun]|uniref:Uncharacterized protein n=1 Tax=Thelephora ganbajun TaxID=370292 RepID=A0ACB6Z8G2_THEGA|nr:hypothetical protein BDM02DRAFT_3119623 [Thelephora ganbajun]